jgi:Flp pilus assembly protein TadD
MKKRHTHNQAVNKARRHTRGVADKDGSPAAQLLASAIALQNAGSFDKAEVIYRRLLATYPDDVGLLNLLGPTIAQQGRLEEALRVMEKVVSLAPGHAEAHYSLGLTLQRLARYHEAVSSYDRALRLNPRYTGAYHNRGIALFHLAHYKAAAESFAAVVALAPEHVDARYNMGIFKLLLGDFQAGLPLYEWRWKRQEAGRPRIFAKPLWLGSEPIAGKTILLHAEQGIGDTIQFCRYTPMAAAVGAAVLLEVQRPLVRLLSRLQGVSVVIPRGHDLPYFELHCPLLSLPLAFGTSLETVPDTVPYLSADPDNKKEWQQRLGPKRKIRVGLAWSGAPAHENDKNRSIPLRLLAPLIHDDVEYHSLQKEVRPADAAFLDGSPIARHDEQLNDFLDTASLVSEMDLIISVDTAIAHLAGALGRPVWIMLPFVPDWRWLTERESTPWYPSARLFRQLRRGDWGETIARVKSELILMTNTFRCRRF